MTKLKIPEVNLGSYIIPKDASNEIAVDIGCNVGGFLKKITIYSQRFIITNQLKNVLKYVITLQKILNI